MLNISTMTDGPGKAKSSQLTIISVLMSTCDNINMFKIHKKENLEPMCVCVCVCERERQVSRKCRASLKSEVAQSCPTFCDSMYTRLLRPWDFLGKSTGVDCHFLLQKRAKFTLKMK